MACLHRIEGNGFVGDRPDRSGYFVLPAKQAITNGIQDRPIQPHHQKDIYMKHSPSMIRRVATTAAQAWAQPNRAVHRDGERCTPEQFGRGAVVAYAAAVAALVRVIPVDFKQEEMSFFPELALHVATQWATSDASKSGPSGPVSADAFGASVAAAYSETLIQLRLTLEQQAVSAGQGSVDV